MRHEVDTEDWRRVLPWDLNATAAIRNEKKMTFGIRVCFACFGVMTVTTIGGCGETNEDRRQISQRTKDLAGKVKSDPESKEGQAAMKELIRILNGNWTFARSQACYAMDDLGPLAASAVPHLIEAAKTSDRFVRQDAVLGLRSIGPTAAGAVDFLIDLVEAALTQPNTNAPLRVIYAVQGLGNIGEPALRAMPILERASHSNDQILAKEAQRSLAKLQQIVEVKSHEMQSVRGN